ncbi:MAG TPA: hypothetical protein VN666_22005 [Nitrospira sp.]|nr:hypothetical protein [Nitrospira sp.]
MTHFYECEEDLPDDVILACAFLEAKGYEFLSHFNLCNAVDVAEQVYRAECNGSVIL